MKKNSAKKAFQNWKNDFAKYWEAYGQAMMKI